MAERNPSTGQPEGDPHSGDSLRIDPATGLPLPDPYPDYLVCPHCGEAEVEVWCYQLSVQCHNCGRSFEHTPPPLCGTYPYCKRGERGDAGSQPAQKA